MGTVSILFFVCVASLIRGYDTFLLKDETKDCNGRTSPDDQVSCTTIYKEKDEQCMFIVHNQALSDHDVEIKFGYLENEESEGCVLDSLDFTSSKTEGQSYGDSLLGRVFASIGNTIDQGLRKDEPLTLAGFKAFITFKPPHDGTCDENQVYVQQGSRKECLTGEKCDSICQHGGTCVRQGRDERCYCKDGFTGDDCSKPVLRFRKAPEDRALEKHSSIYAECQLDVPKGIEVIYKWTLNGGIVGDYYTDTGFGVHPHGLLEIDSFVEEFEGQYTCIANSVLGTAEHTFQYRMVSLCVIKIRPGPGIVKRNIGRSALLRCNAKPFNKVNNVLWKKMGVPIDFTNGRFQMKSNFYLQINKIQLSDQGDYSCHVEDNNGCRTSKQGKLIVLDYLPLNKYCGKSTWDDDNLEFRLTHSKDAETNQYPWHVIFRSKTWISKTFCGGTLISRRFVLTAAHCISDFGNNFSSKTVAFFLGTTDCLGGGIERTVKNYTIHPNYRKTARYDNDIAIIELDTPVEYGDSIRPICLGEQGFFDENFLEKEFQTSLTPSSGRVVGCGQASENGNLHAVLQVLNVPYVPRQQCEKSVNIIDEPLPDSMFCAGSAVKDMGDACQGDSGGGLIMQTNEQWILVGIVSAGIGCDRAEYYGMYTNVGLFYDWVNGITRFDVEQDDAYLLETRLHKALRFLKAPQGRNIQKGQSINPDCKLDVPRDIEVQYQWTLDGVFIGPYSNKTGFGTHPGGVLSIDKFTENYEGTYACIANTKSGTAEHTFNYRIVSKCEVEIYHGPGSVKKNVGQKVLLPCLAKPVRKVERVSWKKNGVPIDYSDGRFEMRTNYYLQISDIKLSDQGSYSCHAEDRNGCSLSKKGTLTVLDYQPLNKLDESSFCNNTIIGDERTTKTISNSVRGTNCFYRIEAEGDKLVQLKLLQLDFDARPCAEESVIVYEGRSTHGKKLLEICSHTTPQVVPFPAKSFFIEYRNPLNNGQEDAFKIEYTFASPVGGDNDCSGRFINLPDGNLTYTSPFQENNKHCVIVVRNTMLHDHFVQIKFQYFEIEESEDCKFDSLKIFSGERKESPALGGPYCGESLHGRTFVSSGNSLRLEFKTDESFALRGFKAEITFEPVYDCTCDEKRICIRQGYEKRCLAGRNCNDANCQNGGTCVEKAGEKRCYCKAGFEGDDCSVGGDTHEALRFKKAPQGRNIHEGHSINPDCKLDVHRDIEVQYQWTLDGVPIGPYSSETGFGTHPGGLLEIEKFTEKYEGTYACIANTVLGTAEHTFNYRIASKCEIEIYPGPGSVKKNVGQKVLLPCNAKPVRKVHRVSWKKNGVPIDFSDGRFEMKTNYYLQISDIKLSDQGSYSCHAEDRNGYSLSKKGTLTVLDYQPLNKYCGISTWDEDVIRSRLSQAADARVNEHPWHANFRTKTTPPKSFCGGTLISRRFVLTAAHCIDEFRYYKIGPFSSMTVSIFFGTTDCLGGGIKRTVRNYTIHSNYNKNSKYDNDIAIIELDTPLEYGDSIRPICLAEKGFVDVTFLEKNFETSLRMSTGRVAGCGKQSQRGQLHSSLQVVNLPYVPQEECEDSFSAIGKTLTDSMFCAGSKVARTGDPCQGDDGGGLVMPTDEHWILTGIVSYRVGCHRQNHYGVYTHVGLFYDWIKEKTKFDEEEVENILQERN